MSFNPSEPRVPAGSPGGGRWGGGGSGGKANAPRNAAAGKAQANPKAAQMYDKLNGSKSADERAKYLQGLSDEDLELLTQAVYGTRTSDPKVVQARLAVAREMGKRGIDIKKYGALGGGSPSKAAPARKVTPAQRAAVAHVRARTATKPPVKAAAKPAYKGPTQAPSVHGTPK